MVAVFVYAGLGLAANWPTWPGDPSRLRPGDLDQMVWFLGWTPYALFHGHNLFFTTAINYPQGINLAQNTSSPLLGLLTTPITLIVSPIASLNLLLWLAFPLSASSMFFVLRRFVDWDLAAFAGGAIYGFSPYVVTQSLDHLNLAFVPLPPMILLALYEIFRHGQERPYRWGVILGVLVTAQFFISPEIATTTILVAGVTTLMLATATPGEIHSAVRRGARSLLVAAVIVAVCVAYPVWIIVAGPYRYHGLAYPGGVSADLLGTFTPTSMQRFAPSSISAAGSKLLFGNISESGSYLGLPLLVLMTLFLLQCWNKRWIRPAASMVVATIVLSLGPHLVVGNHVTSIPLPFDLLLHFPLVGDILASRLALYTALFAGLLVALAMDEMRARALLSSGARFKLISRAEPSPAGMSTVALWAARVLAFVCIVSLIPRWPFPTSPASVPTYFSSYAVSRVPAGSVALISPYPSVAEVQPQVWQAIAGMRFDIIGGYGLFADAVGTSSNFPAVLRPEDVQRFLWAQATGGAAYPVGPVPLDNARLVCDLRVFLHGNQVGTVLATAVGAQPQIIYSLFSRVLGQRSMADGTVSVWYDVQRDLQRDKGQCGSALDSPR